MSARFVFVFLCGACVLSLVTIAMQSTQLDAITESVPDQREFRGEAQLVEIKPHAPAPKPARVPEHVEPVRTPKAAHSTVQGFHIPKNKPESETSDTASDKASDTASDTASGKASDKASGKASDTASGKASDTASDKASEIANDAEGEVEIEYGGQLTKALERKFPLKDVELLSATRHIIAATPKTGSSALHTLLFRMAELKVGVNMPQLSLQQIHSAINGYVLGICRDPVWDQLHDYVPAFTHIFPTALWSPGNRTQHDHVLKIRDALARFVELLDEDMKVVVIVRDPRETLTSRLFYNLAPSWDRLEDQLLGYTEFIRVAAAHKRFHVVTASKH
jgi:hypothetical protein